MRPIPSFAALAFTAASTLAFVAPAEAASRPSLAQRSPTVGLGWAGAGASVGAGPLLIGGYLDANPPSGAVGPVGGYLAAPLTRVGNLIDLGLIGGVSAGGNSLRPEAGLILAVPIPLQGGFPRLRVDAALTAAPLGNGLGVGPLSTLGLAVGLAPKVELTIGSGTAIGVRLGL